MEKAVQPGPFIGWPRYQKLRESCRYGYVTACCDFCKSHGWDHEVGARSIHSPNERMVGQRIAPDEEDRAEVEVLRARLEKTIQLTKKIKISQTRLDTSGSSVKEAIGPVYGNTQRLQVLGANIDQLNDAIDKIRQPLDIKAQEEDIIFSGPHVSGLLQYLASLERVSEALAELTATPLRLNKTAISELQALLNSGTKQLVKVFQQELEEDSSQVEPLHYITKQIPFPLIAEAKLSTLRKIHAVIATPLTQDYTRNSQTSPTSRKYAEVRGQYLVSSLQNLAAASINTTKKRTPDAVYRRGTNGIGIYATAMEGLFLSEHDNIRSLFAPGDWSRVFIATCTPALSDFAKTLGELNEHVRANLATDCFLAFEIIDIVTTVSHKLDDKTGDFKKWFDETLKRTRETATKSFPELLDDTRRRIMHMQNLPLDGATVSVTVDTMMRLQNMTDFLQPISAVLVTLGDGNWGSSAAPSATSSASTSLKSFDVGADGYRLLMHYCLDTIDTLLQNLEAKAKGILRSKSVLGVFIANNTAIVERTIRTSELGSLLSSSLSRIDMWRKKGVSLYLDGWKDPSSYLLDVQYTNRGGQRPPSGSSATVNSAEIVKALSHKDRDAIKDKFRSFNASFEDLVNRHKSLTMEREVRALLGREVQALIEPLYGRFWDRYHEIDKGKGKYVKLDKSQLGAILAGLG